MDWEYYIRKFFNSCQGEKLEKAYQAAYQKEEVFPDQANIFRAFQLTPLDKVKVVILGQDPYHDDGQANGLAFSVNQGQKLPPSLKNIYKELSDDLKLPMPTHGDLSKWAKQGVLLLNTTLTVKAHQAHSHKHLGWDLFTQMILNVLADQPQPIVFILWGKAAHAYQNMIHQDQHRIIMGPHPSPLSAYRGFFGSRPFSKTNAFLIEAGLQPIDWDLSKDTISKEITD